MPHSTLHIQHLDSDESVILFPDLILYCGYSLRVNPYRLSVVDASERWLLDGAYLSDKKRKAFLRLKAGDLASMCYPDVSAKSLRIVADFMNYLFKLDDWTDEFEAEDIDGMRDCVLAALWDPLHYETEKAVGKLAKSCVHFIISIILRSHCSESAWLVPSNAVLIVTGHLSQVLWAFCSAGWPGLYEEVHRYHGLVFPCRSATSFRSYPRRHSRPRVICSPPQRH